MSRKLRLGYLAHTLRSDWNNGNAHFLRGLLRAVQLLGSDVTAFEPEHGWSIDHLREEPGGERSLECFRKVYPDLHIRTYDESAADAQFWRGALSDVDVVIVHEWNSPAVANAVLQARDEAGYKVLFHDTHHRASSSPEQIRLMGIDRCDGVLAFGKALETIYRERFGIDRVWTLHEAADTTVFQPQANQAKTVDVVWIGNWGDDERSKEIRDFLLKPAADMPGKRVVIHGVRYPEDALEALNDAGVEYAGYLPNLGAPSRYASARATVHIPRQQYTQAMMGIPTIRVFEALACSIPLVSAPWTDTEGLFREGDFLFVKSGHEMTEALQYLLADENAAREQARRGRETVLARHTCRHRAERLLTICEETLG